MLRVIPLGGLGEVGLNTLALEHAGERLLVDCGLMFPRIDQPGAEVVVPDFTWLLDTPQDLKGIVLTHAHEDHVGALPWLLRELDVPVYGTPYTLALARHRLEEAQVKADLRPFGPGETFQLGEHFRVEPVRVAHSVPDAVGLVVRTPAATLVHTGDFKLDGMPVDGQLTDLKRLGEVGEEGVDVLLSDSTNAEVKGSTPSERVVSETFERLLAHARGRVVIALFGSHLHRVASCLELAKRASRKVVLLGRSLQRNVDLARSVGLMRIDEGLTVPVEEAGLLPPASLLVLCTGAQAEARSGLSWLIGDEPGPLKVQRGDTVVFSARTIPGNEPFVTRAINRVLELGARAVYPAVEPGVHVSGHAASDEQRRMLETVRPRAFVPIHGERRHLEAHARLARQLGLTGARTLLLTDGDVAGFSAEGPATLGRVPAGQRLMRREGVSAIDATTLARRRALAEAGLVVATVARELGSGRLLQGPLLTAEGLSPEETAALGLAQDGARLALLEVSDAVRGDDERVREELVRGVRRVFKQVLGSRPNVLPVVLRLPRGG